MPKRLFAQLSYRLLVAVLVVVAVRARPAHAQRPLNLDFEMPSAGVADEAWGWSRGWSAFAAGPAARFTLDTAIHAQGTRSLRIVAADSGADAPARGLMLQLPGVFAHGRRLTLTGAIRRGTLRGQAFVTLEAWGDRVVPASDTGRLTAGAEGRWQRFSLLIDVPHDASIHSIVIMPAVQGAGTAWFDDFTLAVDGVPMDGLATGAAPTAEQLRWLAGRSVPLTSTAPDDALSSAPDLAYVDRIVGDAQVVALGESTHGTSEFFSVKHRLVQHLVRRGGFTVFALEANQRAVERMDAWVQGGPGTARDALAAVFAVWNTEEMITLLEWMRAHNATAAHRVRVVGYDMQDHRAPADSLLAFLALTEPGYGESVAQRTAAYRASLSYATPQSAQTDRRRWHATAGSIVTEMRARRSGWLARARTATDSQRVEAAVHDADLFRQAALLNVTLASPDRDSLMAANLDWLLRGPHRGSHRGSRTIVWAHDVHVSRGGDARRSFNGGAQMGAHVARTYGHDYRAFSLLTREGDYTATRSFTDHTLISARGFPAPRGSVEAMLGAIPRPSGAPGLVVDVRVGEKDPAGAWLWAPRPLRHLGFAAYDYGFEMSAVMPLEFDGIIFVDRSSASRPIRRPP